ncbi:MAG TPA: aldolase [Desulfotomaculum sp.]|nr:MAG: aldolase [Desulfotomaculum sp. BICA1-6]HBX22178.1 aldolase [Desulfotomaculum sp.]
MSFIDNLIDKSIDRMLGGERKIKSPIFIKDFTQENQQLKDLIALNEKLTDGPKKEWIERDIIYLKEGLKGEENVYYELKNSFLPILCLHDIRLEYDGYVAQFDFIVISNKFICVLETKKLSGDIIINQDGDFVRKIKNKYGKEVRREGMYSPISQNQRHLDILREILVTEKLVKHWPLKSLVVMANPKTIISKKYCPKTIGNSIYKYDQVVNCLRKFQDDKTNEMNVFEKNMYKIAEFLIDNNEQITINYISKYGLTDSDYIKENTSFAKTNHATPIRKERNQLYQLLKEFRLNKSREENIKAYFIFNNEQMEDMILKYPTTELELLKVNGFGIKKVEKYGKDILSIFTA